MGLMVLIRPNWQMGGMMKKKVLSFEDLDIYRLAEDLGDRVWNIVSN